MNVQGLHEMTVRFKSQDTDKHREAAQMVYAMLSNSPGDHVSRANTHVQNGIRRYGLGDAAGALAEFKESIRICASPAAYFNRGLVAMEISDWERAVADFGATVQLTPDYADAYFNRAMSVIKCLYENNSDGSDEQLAEITEFIISDFEKAASLGHPDAAEYVRDLKRDLAA